MNNDLLGIILELVIELICNLIDHSEVEEYRPNRKDDTQSLRLMRGYTPNQFACHD